MKNLKVNQVIEKLVKEVSVDYNESNYKIIYGKACYTIFGASYKGGFFIITNHGVSGGLACLSDVSYNARSIGRALNNMKAGNAIALAIKEIGYN